MKYFYLKNMMYTAEYIMIFQVKILHVNSTISDSKSRYMYVDMKYFYLKNMMYTAEYIMIQIYMIPQDFWKNKISRKKRAMYISSQGQLRECMDSLKPDR